MLDTSVSMTDRLKDLYAGAEQFLLRLLPHDKAAVGAFNDKIEFASGFSNDRNSLVASLKHLDFGNQTRLYDSVYASLDELKKRGRAQGDSVVHRWRRFRQPPGIGKALGACARRRSDDLRHRSRDRVLQRTVRRQEQAGLHPQSVCGRNRRRLFRLEERCRPQLVVHSNRAGAAAVSICSASAPRRSTANCTSSKCASSGRALKSRSRRSYVASAEGTSQ